MLNELPRKLVNKFRKELLWRTYGAIAMFTIITVASLGYLLHSSHEMNSRHFPLIEAASGIQLRITTAHLWLEEIISGDSNEDIGEVWKNLQNAKQHTNVLLNGLVSNERTSESIPEQVVQPLDKEHMRELILEVQRNILLFQNMTHKRWASKAVSVAGTEIDQEYDAIFNHLIQNAEKLQFNLRTTIKNETMLHYRVVLSLIAITVLAALWLCIILARFVHERTIIETNLATHISTIKTNEQELRKLSIAVEQSPAGIIITDTSGTIEYVNPRFTEMTGFTQEEAIGQNPRILKSDKWPKKAYEGLWETILAGKTWRGEFENKKKNGELYWESASISPVRNALGEVTHFLAVKEDITNRKLREEQLSQAIVAAEAADHAKSEFLANMSHEIRTPMTAILGFADLLLEEGDRDKAPQHRIDIINTIRSSGHYLLTLINDILDLSKIEAGRMMIEKITFNICDLLDEVALLIGSRMDAKPLQFKYEYDGLIPETIQTDPTRLRQVLINIISNAIKFTDEGEVKLITRFVDNGCEPMMQFDVIDTGVGISPEETSLLFQPFMQVDTSTTRKFGGTGLGLIISKRFAEMLGGDIILVESKPGRGSRFRITIATGSIDEVRMLEKPMPSTRVDDTIAHATPLPQMDLRGCNILLAEDCQANHRLISLYLTKAGAEVTVKENGKLALDDALAALDAGTPYDVILMDMQMPVMDGYEATRQLRRNNYTGPIIAVTAHAMKHDRDKCIDAGCDDYTTKPIDRNKLITLIHSYFTRGDNEMKPSNDNSNTLVSELSEDAGMANLIELYVAEMPERITAIQKALENQELDALASQAHQLKGSAGGYGFPTISEAARVVEMGAKGGEVIDILADQTKALIDLCHKVRTTELST